MAIVAANGAQGNWTTGASWVGGIAPTAADDAQIGAGTTTLTIDAGALCRSADFNGFTGTLTQGASGTLTIGDGTAGASNIALRLPAGATYVPNVASTISFVSTSATQQTVSAVGYTIGNITFNSTSNGNYAITSALTIDVAATLTLTQGTLHTDGTADISGFTHSWGFFSSSNSNVRALLLGNSTINFTGASLAWTTSTATNMTLTKGTSVLNFTGAASVINLGNLSYYTINFTGSGIAQIGGGATIVNLTRTGTAIKTDSFLVGVSAYTITGSLVLAGNSITNRLLVYSTTIGTSAGTFTLTGATVTCSNLDVRDQTWTPVQDLSAITGKSGDCGGNTGITFTTAAPRYAVAAGNWSSTAVWSLTDGGASGAAVPLPQDSVIINGNSGVGTITLDMPRAGSGWNFTGYTGTFSVGVNTTMYGSITISSGMTVSGAFAVTLEGRGTHTFTSSGKTTTFQFNMVSSGGTYTLQDDLINTNGSGIAIQRGTFNANNFNITGLVISSAFSGTRTINMGTGVWTFTSSGAVFNFSSTGMTLNPGTSTILISDTSASAKTFSGGGLTYYNLVITGGGSGTVTITGANTFNTLKVLNGTKSIVLPGATTTTLLGETSLGNGTNLITFTASAGSATISQSGGKVNWDYVSLTNIPSTGGAAFYAGPTTHSTDGGGNTGWIFTNAPGGSGSGLSNDGAAQVLAMGYSFI